MGRPKARKDLKQRKKRIDKPKVKVMQDSKSNKFDNWRKEVMVRMIIRGIILIAFVIFILVTYQLYFM